MNTKFRRTSDEAARLGHPSYVWRAGQERRLALVRQWARLDGASHPGCRLRRGDVHRAVPPLQPARDRRRGRSCGRRPGRPRLPGIVLAPAEALPFADGSSDVVFSHEVIEHVADDAAAAAHMTVYWRPVAAS